LRSVLCGVGAYLLGGILYRRSKGYRGTEAFPNLDFWSGCWDNVKVGIGGS
jgi:hypothetical protein